MRKWPIVSLILLAVSSLSVAAAKQDVFIYGESNYPPYTWIDNGEFRGIYVDIFNKAFEKMEDYNIQLKAVPWERGLFLLSKERLSLCFLLIIIHNVARLFHRILSLF